MSRFYGSIEGQASTEATRCGSKASGITGHIRGWNLGVRVIGGANEADKDVFTVYVSGGSNGGSVPRFGFTVSETEDGYSIEHNDGSVAHYAKDGTLRTFGG